MQQQKAMRFWYTLQPGWNLEILQQVTKKKPVTKTIYAMILLIWSTQNGQVLETESTLLFAKGQWGKGETGSDHEFDDNLEGDDECITVNIHNTMQGGEIRDVWLILSIKPSFTNPCPAHLMWLLKY